MTGCKYCDLRHYVIKYVLSSSFLSVEAFLAIRSFKVVGQFAIVAHCLAGSLEALSELNIAVLQALSLISIQATSVECSASEALVEAANEHLSLELLDVHLSLCVHFVLLYYYL
jgi:hypothetical protein